MHPKEDSRFYKHSQNSVEVITYYLGLSKILLSPGGILAIKRKILSFKYSPCIMSRGCKTESK